MPRRGRYPIDLAALVEGLRQGNVPHRAVVLTFDDGYADALYAAKPLLPRYEVPATVFVVSGALGRRFWWDVLAELVLSSDLLPPGLERLSTGRAASRLCQRPAHGWMAGGDGDARRQLLASLYADLLPMLPEDREEFMGNLLSSAAVGAPNARALTGAELIQLAVDGLVDIGAHTVSHSKLAALPLAVQRAEIQQSKDHLEELLGRHVSSFSYPHGSVSADTASLVRDSDFVCACASQQDVVWRGSDVFQLPRF